MMQEISWTWFLAIPAIWISTFFIGFFIGKMVERKKILKQKIEEPKKEEPKKQDNSVKPKKKV